MLLGPGNLVAAPALAQAFEIERTNSGPPHRRD